MTLGQKILKLRSDAGISQEQLSEILGVSRQSVSKWEMDQALPQIDKVLQISEYFNISTDELLREKLDIKKSDEKPIRNKYFGNSSKANVPKSIIQNAMTKADFIVFVILFRFFAP